MKKPSFSFRGSRHGDLFNPAHPKFKQWKAKIKAAMSKTPASTGKTNKSFNTQEGEAMPLENFEELFKSEEPSDEMVGECPHCGEEIVIKGEPKGKKGKKSGTHARHLGNEMDPHRGGKTGSFVAHPRGGKKTPVVERAPVTTPKLKAGGVAKSMFPNVGRVQLVHYEGTTDSALSKSLTDGTQLDAGSLRNLAMEHEAGTAESENEGSEE